MEFFRTALSEIYNLLKTFNENEILNTMNIKGMIKEM